MVAGVLFVGQALLLNEPIVLRQLQIREHLQAPLAKEHVVDLSPDPSALPALDRGRLFGLHKRRIGVFQAQSVILSDQLVKRLVWLAIKVSTKDDRVRFEAIVRGI